MRLLLDEIWPHAIATELRRLGHNVIAVTERSELCGQPDAVIFAAAQAGGRAVVTENVSDFRPLAAELLERGHTHAGLILTTHHRYPRHDLRTIGRLISALDAWFSTCPTVINLEHWLA